MTTKTTTADPHARKDRRGTLLASAGVLVLVGGLYVGAHYLIGDRLPVGTKVAGVAVGGKSPAEARSILTERLDERSQAPVELVSGDQEFSVEPADAGLSLDLDATIARAGGGSSWNPVRMVRAVVGSAEVDAVVETDDAKLEGSVATIADAVDTAAVEPQITFKDREPEVRDPADGVSVEREEAARLIQERYLSEGAADAQPLEVPTRTLSPTVDSEAVDAELESYATPAMEGPVTVVVGADQVPLPVRAYASALTIAVQDGELVPTVDPEKLADGLEAATESIGQKARDATVELRGGTPTVVPAQDGIGVDPQAVATALVPVLDKTGDARRISLSTTVTKPSFTTAQAQALGVKEQVSTFSTRFPYAEYRNVNQSRAAALIDGTLIKPGETFSFNDTVGERTAANGFTTGSIIADGVFREELGGGVSQVVTTTYNAGFFAGLEDVEHKPHSFYISRYPVGREATVAWPSVDLKIKNDTKYGVLISANVKKSSPGSQGVTTVSMYSTKTWDVTAGVSGRTNLRQGGTRADSSDRCVPQQGVTGFDVTVYRYFAQNGKRVKTESIPARYNAADTVICK
ncbi:VanW family protein [Solicola sp. PLA-1-18]|uniref:VanW family protein n=1 Tax=Solicola sp. PLA-1-18 TaxID=3380532 RepID=UPI003B7B6D09